MRLACLASRRTNFGRNLEANRNSFQFGPKAVGVGELIQQEIAGRLLIDLESFKKFSLSFAKFLTVWNERERKKIVRFSSSRVSITLAERPKGRGFKGFAQK